MQPTKSLLVRLQPTAAGWGIPVVLYALLCAPALAFPPSQQVFAAPGGRVIGGVRSSDTVEIKQRETVDRNGRRERWAYITYGDRYTQAAGWVNLDTFRKQPRQAQAGPATPYPGTLSPDSTPVSIWDINMHCAKNQRRIIHSCALQMVVDIPQIYNHHNTILACSAELFWTDLSGTQRVSKQQTSQPLNADNPGRRQRLKLHFNFGPSGARSASVENQRCQIDNARPQRYAPY